MRIAIAQLNPTVGDVAGNTRLVLAAVEHAQRDGADLIVCPEMVLMGYPPRDLLFREGAVEAAEAAVETVAEHARGLTVIVGHPRRCRTQVRTIRNSATVCRDGAILAVYDKRLLPGYDIFDEDRYFDPGEDACVVDVGGVRVGVLICEDLWRAGDVPVDRTYPVDPMRDLIEGQAEVVVSLNASPFVLGKHARHVDLMRAAAERHGVPIVSAGMVGGADDLVFDGRSLAMSATGKTIAALPAWTEAVHTVDLDAPASDVDVAPDRPEAEIFDALVLGVRDYCRKTGHEKVLVGLSGGIDSALTATIAVAALGPEHVGGITMPSMYSSTGSIEDSAALAGNLGLGSFEEIGIGLAHQAMRQALAPTLGDRMEGLTDENLQARLRGVLLMAHANAHSALVLATGNKSELAVGYATLYGDMSGALAVLGDVVKTRVYALARWINVHHASRGFGEPPIPSATISKPPSAELRPDQTDQDSLPPYDVLDVIIERSVELEQSVERIIDETGIEPETVRQFVNMIDRAEYKRHQAALVLKVTQRSFGRGRPMPIVLRSTAVAPPLARDVPR